MDEYEFPDLTIDDFRPLPGDLECIGYEEVIDHALFPFSTRLESIWAEVEERDEFPL